MKVYLSSPGSQLHADKVRGMDVLVSFALWKPWLARYVPSFNHMLIDSGAYSELTGNAKVDLGEYREWSCQFRGKVDAIAGLDDISGDWKRSLTNYDAIPWGFPTYHETDPPELLKDLLALAKDRGRWIGIGMLPPRVGKREWLLRTCEEIPDGFHVHGWALRGYASVARLDSVDSTNWMRDGMKVVRAYPWLTYGEALEIVIKRYQRWERQVAREQLQTEFPEILDCLVQGSHREEVRDASNT